MTSAQLDAIPTWPFLVALAGVWLAVAWSHHRSKPKKPLPKWWDVPKPKKPWKDDRR